MKKQNFIIAVLFVMALSSAAAALSEPMIFPKEGQSSEQQTQDKTACESWAKDETKVDVGYVKAKIEMAEAQGGTTSRDSTGKTIFKAAAAGAAFGAIDKNIDNKVGSGATKGVLAGAIVARNNKKEAANEQAAQQNAAEINNLLAQYDQYMRALSVCMDAKGYSVK